MHQDYPYVDPSTGDYHEQIGAEGYSHFANDDVHVNGYDEAAGIFGSIANFVSGAAKGIASGVSSVANVVQKGVGAITNNPLWDIARTGVSFIPGVGTAVSAGMAGASAIGRGDSLKDIGLAAAKGAIPGGPAAQAAFDVALGLAKGKNVTETILQAARSQVPGGDLGKAAFDAANAIARGKAFDAIALDAIRSKVPGGAVGKAAFDGAIANFKAKKGGGAADGSRPFAHLNLVGNRVASAMNARPELMRAPASSVARDLNVSVENVQKAFAAFMSKWGDARRAWTDVGASDSLESCCEREAIPMGAGDFDDAGFLQSDTGAADWGRGGPRLAMSKPYAQALYRHGHNGVRQGMLAHGILARLHHQTGELDGAGGWMIRSGDTPSAIAQKMTGSAARWKEMLAVNPKLKVVTVNGVTQVQPFIPGQRITLPTSWLGTAAPAPQVTPAGAPPLTGAQPTIQQGSTGQTVKQWQQLLLNLGSVLVGAADGIFGPQTAAATKAYQAARGLQPDGIVGPLTWGKAMAEAAAKAGGPPPIVVSVPPIVVRPPVPGLPPVSLPPVSLPPMAPPPSMPPIVVSTPPVVVGPAVPSSAPQVAIGAVEAALAYFFQQHPDAQFITVPSYGLMPEDHSGTWDDRDKTAMLGFQKWCNDNPGKVGFPLPISGQPDELSVKALQAITAADLSRQTGQKIPPPPPIVTPPAGKPPVVTAGSSDDSGLLLLGLGGAALVLMMGGKGRRAA